MRRDEVENAVHAVVGDVLAVEATLVLEVLLVRAVDVLLDGAPAESTEYEYRSCNNEISKLR